MQKKNFGFTLIELLIVVAIIAILAAIAIPNFLAAQIRAKVAQVKKEHQTITTALESYYVDNTSYPLDFLGWPPAWPYYLPNAISTPITYISSNKIYDPFAALKNPGGSAERIGERYRYVNWITRGGSGMVPYLQGTEGDGMWRLWSLGPDRDPETATNEYYDPSNGTVSNGDIYRTQKYGVGRAGFTQ